MVVEEHEEKGLTLKDVSSGSLGGGVVVTNHEGRDDLTHVHPFLKRTTISSIESCVK